jgi:nucleoside-diphosphate-sugar epimerase
VIVGSGFIANAFREQYSSRNDICIHAAGVSNSMCTDATEFLRDKKLLSHSLAVADNFDKFIYISSCSVQDPLMDSMYVQHKREMENLALSVENCLIVSLPQIAGFNENPYTILNAFYNSILKKQSISILSNAYRNIIDIHDVVAIVAEILPKVSNLRRINVANPISISVMDIISTFEDVLEEKAIINIQEGGSQFIVDVKVMTDIVNIDDYCFDNCYLKSVLKKYYKPSPLILTR